MFGLTFPRASRRPSAVGFLLGFLLGLGGHVAAQEASPYGINAHTPEGPAGDLLLDQAQAAGIRWLRIDFSWQDLEPSRGIFNWQVMDALTAAAASRGLQLFASVGGTPAWATDGLPYSGVPRNVADWTDFCTRSVQRYKTSIRAWGFWNEPNLSGSWDGTRQQFIDIILKPGADAVHAADPGARVAGPELAHLVGGGALWYRWLADIIQQMGSQLDVVTHHAYSISGSAGVTAKLDATTTFGMYPAYWDYIPPSVREVLVSTGWFGRPFWLTESGWASNLVGEAGQASYLTGLLNDWFTEAPGRGWVGKIFFYELIDDGRPGIDLFGILRSDLTRKPAYDAYRSFIQAAPAGSCTEVLPVVLDNVAGLGGSHYTTELTLASKATTAIQVDLLYNASVGSGTGTVSVTLGPGETRIIPNTISFLRSQGLSISTSGDVIGTLLATFDSSSSDPFIGARTFTTGGGGTFGLFYPAAATTTTTATLVGLQQNDAQRSNLALVNTGGTPITLRVQLFGPMGEDLGTLPDQSLPSYGWTQINQPLAGKAASGRAVITETAGASPFTAYAVLNDAVTSDGSFIPPLIATVSRPGDRLVPIVLDVYGLGGSHYTTQLTLANLTLSSLPVTLVYTASLGSGSGQATLTLAPGEQRIVPDAIRFLRSQGLAIPNDGSSVGGSLLALPLYHSWSSEFAVGARTFTPASSGGGTFGLYYPGLTLGESATSVVYVNGLQQNSSQRSNLALVNRGDADDSITLNVSYFDATGAALGTPTTVMLAPGQWMQFGQPLQAFGATSGYAKIEKTSGNSTFVAYGVLNDAVTSDGSYIPMSF